MIQRRRQMNSRRTDSLQVSSDQLDGRLATIEDRLTSIEVILAHANRQDIEELVKAGVNSSPQRRELLRLCEHPRSIADLTDAMKLNSRQALHIHLRPLREHGLVQHASTEPEVTYEWSALLRRLPKSVRDELLK